MNINWRDEHDPFQRILSKTPFMSRVTRINESWHTHERIVSHILMSHIRPIGVMNVGFSNGSFFGLCVYIHIYIYINMCTYIYIYILIYIYIYIHIFTYMYVYIYMCVYTYVFTYIYVCMYKHTCACIFICIDIYIPIHECVLFQQIVSRSLPFSLVSRMSLSTHRMIHGTHNNESRHAYG